MDAKVYLSMDYSTAMNTGKVASLTIVLLFMMSGLATSGCLEEIENDGGTDQNDNLNTDRTMILVVEIPVRMEMEEVAPRILTMMGTQTAWMSSRMTLTSGRTLMMTE
tara:strand:- start:389 stop:712 length:324 start_codon:yes stop_codon:yes gene_type:complete